MVRKLAIAAFTLSAMSSGIVQALGLGEATVQSSLNQPLKAQIELVNVRDLQQNEILTNLADREEFLRAGVERVFFLSDLRFRVEMQSDGQAVIKVTSSKPVREPFLNFLVEINWPSGRLLREYALLIDPPTFSEQQAHPVAAATTTAPARTATTPRTPRQPARTSVAPAPSQPAFTGDTYGPTGGNDTMWSIAMKTRPDSGVSPQQMMLAIQDLNPDAFLDGNINRLKRGQILRIPDRDQIQTRSARDAITEASAQNRAFQQGTRTRVVDATAATDTADAGTGLQGEDQLRIVVAEEGDTADANVAQAGTGTTVGGTVDSAEMAVALEQLDRSNRENEELKSRLEELQEQLETMQRLVSLKDDQLAAMQGDAAQPADTMIGDLGDPTTGLADPADTLDTGIADAGDPAMTGDTAVSDTGDAAMTSGADQTATSGQATPAASPATTEKEEKPVVKTKPVQTPQQPPSMVEQIINGIKNNVVYQIALGGGAVLLLLLLWMVSRSKARKEEEYFESAQDESAGQVEAAAEDIEEESLDSIAGDAGESDPIAEADVYVAYQKHAQAVQVLEGAIEDEPENYDYRLKLLEVLGETKDSEKFASQFSALEASGDATVLERANEIKERYSDVIEEPGVSLDDLESQLLAGDGLASDSELADSDISEDFELDVDMDTASDLDDTVIQGEAAADFVEETEFDLDNETTLEEEDDLDIDFDLGDIDLEDADTTDKQAMDDKSLEDDLGDIDFDSAVSDTIEDEEDTVITSSSLDSEYDLEDSLEDSDLVTEADDGYHLESEFSDELDELDGLDELETEMQAPETEKAPAEELSLDLDDDATDLSLDEVPESLADDLEDTVIRPPEEETADLDQELEDLGFDEAAAATDEGLDLEADLDLDATPGLSEDIAEEFVQNIDESSLEETISNEEFPQVDSLEETITGIDEVDPDATVQISPEELPEQLAEQNLEETIVQPAAEPGAVDDFVTDMEEDFDFLSDTDEAATKLDLARAYVDMGDKEGARDILEEVVEEGSDEQKKEAADILKSLD